MGYGTKKSSSKGKGKKGNKVCKTDGGHRPATPVEISCFWYLMAAKKGGKKKGADGKACWSGYRHAGTKGGKDKCVPTGKGKTKGKSTRKKK